MADTQAEYWQQVPKINVLSKGPRRNSPAFLIRGLLVVILLLAGFYVLNIYRGQLDIEEDTDALRTQLGTIQLGVSARLRETEELRNLVTQLEEEQQMADRPYQAVTAARVDWDAVLSAIFGARVSGVEFEQVIIQPGRTVGLVGVAEDVDSMVSFRTQMRNVDNILELVSFNLTSASGSDNPTGGNPSDLSIAFNASIRVR